LELFKLDFDSVLRVGLHILVAFALALPIGWDRSQSARSVGLRTFPLVAIASCGFILIGRGAFEPDTGPIASVVQGLLSGIGFIGGGAILKGETSVYGLATAASIWNTAAIGAAIGFDQLEIGIILAAINLALLRLLSPIAESDFSDEPSDHSET